MREIYFKNSKYMIISKIAEEKPGGGGYKKPFSKKNCC